MIDAIKIASALERHACGHACKCEMCADIRVAVCLIRELESVRATASNPNCNYERERECGFVEGVYRHHPKWCPRGRLEAALQKLQENRDAELTRFMEQARKVQGIKVLDEQVESKTFEEGVARLAMEKGLEACEALRDDVDTLLFVRNAAKRLCEYRDRLTLMIAREIEKDPSNVSLLILLTDLTTSVRSAERIP